MPTPTSSETRSQFVKRCIPYVIHEGTAKGPKQAAAICYSLWSRHKVTHNARRRNPLKTDPSRTAMLRRRFVAEMNRRFRRLRKAVIDLVDREDAFGLKTPEALNTRWKPLRSDQQVEAFKRWVDLQAEQGILERTQDGQPWLQSYIDESYAKGQGRAFDDTMKKYDYKNQEAPQYYQGTRDEFLRSSFGRPASAERVGVLASRAFTDLQGVSAAMAAQMQRTLTDSFIQGDHPYVMARKLAKDVDKIGITRARTIARTETIRAHAEGQLDALEQMGVTDVGVMVEWSTAGDSLVCPLCVPLEGIVLKVTEARGMLPRHPNCRCAWIPANVGEPKTLDQRRSKGRIARSIDRSARAEASRKGKPRPSAEAARRRSTWPGVDTPIDPTRPAAVARERIGSRAKRAASAAMKAGNIGPTLAAEVVKEAGCSPSVAKLALAAATIGDFTVPGVPVGSALVGILASIKDPLAASRVARSVIKGMMRML